jgi:hypothetical protein
MSALRVEQMCQESGMSGNLPVFPPKHAENVECWWAQYVGVPHFAEDRPCGPQ